MICRAKRMLMARKKGGGLLLDLLEDHRNSFDLFWKRGYLKIWGRGIS